MHTFSKVIAISALALSLVACGDSLTGEQRLATLVATAQMATMTAQVPTDIAASATAAAEADVAAAHGDEHGVPALETRGGVMNVASNLQANHSVNSIQRAKEQKWG